MPTLLLIRHAQASYGGADYDVLSERGMRQVTVLHDALCARGVRPARLVSGGLRRQRDTAAPWAADGELRIDERWNEYDAADLLGAHSESPARLERPAGEDVPPPPSREFQAVLDDAMHAWIASGSGSPAAEPWPAFRARVQGALEQAAGELGRGETGFVFTSGGVIAAACMLVLGVPDDAFVEFNRTSVNAGITKLIVGSRGTSLVTFNEHAHLEGDGLVTYR